MVLIVSIALCLIEAISLSRAETLNPSNEKKVKIIISNTIKHSKIATVFGTFFLSIQLQNGKNKVAKIPPIVNGIRKSFAKYNPVKINNNNNSFCIVDEREVVIFLIIYLFNV